MIKDYWRRLMMRHAHYSDDWAGFDRLYILKDPWRLGSAAEQARLEWTNDLIARHFSRPATILEIGCGEGHQSVYLARQCQTLYAIDVSKRGVGRARQRCPTANFAIGDPASFAAPAAWPAVFELVTACEVLYYMKDLSAALPRLSALGHACLVSFDASQASRLDPYFAAQRGAESSVLRRGNLSWVAKWWRNPE